MKIIWKDIEGYEEKYQINQLGEIRNKLTGELSKIKPSKAGYVRWSAYLNGEIRIFSVHRLVAQAFIPNPHNYSQVHHKDGNKSNNSIDNLEWVSPKEHGKKMLPEQKERFRKTYKKNLERRRNVLQRPPLPVI